MHGLEDVYNGKVGEDVYVYIYTPTKSMKFKVFSSYISETSDYPINTKITQEVYNEFITNLKEKSTKTFNSDPIDSNQIITLSTCDKSGKNRVLVHAKLEKMI